MSEASLSVWNVNTEQFPEWLTELVVFDLETTGIDVDRDRIVTAHVGRLSPDGMVIESFDWLADPGVEIPAAATAVHGVTTERARAEGRPAAEVVAELVDTLRKATSASVPLVAYNAAYDLSLLDREARRHGISPYAPDFVLDPLIIDKGVDKYRKGKRTLSAATLHYGVTLESAHDASSDAQAAGHVALKLLVTFPELAGLSPAELHAQQVSWSESQAQSFTDWKRANGDPTFTASGEWPIRTVN